MYVCVQVIVCTHYNSLHIYTVLCRSVVYIGKLGNGMHLSLLLYKLKAFVTCSVTELSTREPLPIYLFHWTTDFLQSTVATSYINVNIHNIVNMRPKLIFYKTIYINFSGRLQYRKMINNN